MSNSFEQWVTVSKEAGSKVVHEAVSLPVRLLHLWVGASLTVVSAGSGHLWYAGAWRLLADE